MARARPPHAASHPLRRSFLSAVASQGVNSPPYRTGYTVVPRVANRCSCPPGSFATRAHLATHVWILALAMGRGRLSRTCPGPRKAAKSPRILSSLVAGSGPSPRGSSIPPTARDFPRLNRTESAAAQTRLSLCALSVSLLSVDSRCMSSAYPPSRRASVAGRHSWLPSPVVSGA